MKWDWNKKTIGITAGVILMCALIFFLWKKDKGTSISYSEVTVARGDIATTILSTGVVQPENRLDIKPPIAGRAEQILVEEGAAVKKGQILLWMSSTERAALLDAARSRSPAELKTWEDYYKPTPVFAPIDGSIIIRNIQPGQTFTTADAILTMSDRLTVQAQVDETDIAQIRLEQPADIILDAYPDNVIAGNVDRIAFDAKTVNNVTTYVAYVLPKETPPFMRSGMTANVSFFINNKNGVLLIPTAAIKVKEGHSIVLLVPGGFGKKQQEVDVQTGISDGKRVEVIAGLKEGDKILVPQYKKGGQGSVGNSPLTPYGRPAKPQGK